METELFMDKSDAELEAMALIESGYRPSDAVIAWIELVNTYHDAQKRAFADWQDSGYSDLAAHGRYVRALDLVESMRRMPRLSDAVQRGVTEMLKKPL